ncbi:unnamed protein product [Calypogeia fissa]
MSIARSPSAGAVDISSSSSLGTSSSDSQNSQLNRSHKTFGSLPHPKSQQSEGDKKIHLWTLRKLRARDLSRNMIRKPLWVDGWSTPPWVTRSHGTRDWSQDIAQGKRLPKCNNGKIYTVSTNARKSRPIVNGGGGNRHRHSAGNASEALASLKDRLQQGITVDWNMYADVLRRCSKDKDLQTAKQVHDCIIESGMDKNAYVANNLLDVYIKCGRLLQARRVFDQFEKKTVATWNMMIVGYAKRGHAESAVELFNRMRREGPRPNEVTYLSILKACSSPSALKWGKEVHGCITHTGFESDVRVGTALLQMYAKCGSITEARQVFDNLANRNIFTWNILIGAYADRGSTVEAYRLFLQMRREGFEPDAITYMSILNASASAGELEWVKEVHGHASKARLDLDLGVGNALVHIYAKSGSIEDARLVFDRLAKRDVVTWTAMIGGLAQHGRGHEALELFKTMKADRVKPNEATFVAVLSACCHAGLLDDGRRLFLAMTQDYGIEPTVVHYTCMVDLLGRAGHLEEAKRFISDIPVEPDTVIWTAFLGACRTYGNVELGELAAEELFKLDPNDASTYVLLSNIYAAARKWENVSWVRAMMDKRGVRKKAGRSWIEVDNKVNEFVGGDSSHPESKAIYAYINKLTEQMKAEGYIPDTQLVLLNIEEKEKELAICSHSEKLAIAYGLMRIPGAKPIRVYKNLRVCSDCHTATKFISKVTGREIIARDASRFHHFKDGLCSCGDYW